MRYLSGGMRGRILPDMRYLIFVKRSGSANQRQPLVEEQRLDRGLAVEGPTSTDAWQRRGFGVVLG